MLTYLLISCLATLADASLVWLLYRQLGMGLVVANTLGVLCGFVISYLLAARLVFRGLRNRRGLAVFFLTFLGGLVLADLLIFWGETRWFATFEEGWRFFLSKGLSIVVPFFMMYEIRRRYNLQQERREEDEAS